MFLDKNNTLKWKWIAIAAAIVAVVCALGILWFDYSLYYFLRRFDGTWAKVFDIIFSFKLWIIASGAVFIFQGIRKKEKGIRQFLISLYAKVFRADKAKLPIPYSLFLIPSFNVFFTILLSGALGWVLKVAIGRMRPVFLDALSQTGFYPFMSEWAFNSMPSGHAIASFAGLVMIGLLYPRWKWITWTLAIIIGISRIAFGAHFPSDVILGAFIGMVCADFVKAKGIMHRYRE